MTCSIVYVDDIREILLRCGVSIVVDSVFISFKL